MLSFLIVKTSCGDETSGLRFARVVMVLPGAAFLLACLLACRSRLDFQIFQMEKTRNCNFVLSLSHTHTLSLFCFLISLTFTHTHFLSHLFCSLCLIYFTLFLNFTLHSPLREGSLYGWSPVKLDWIWSKKENMWLLVCRYLGKQLSPNLETSRTVILPSTVSVLCNLSLSHLHSKLSLLSSSLKHPLPLSFSSISPFSLKAVSDLLYFASFLIFTEMQFKTSIWRGKWKHYSIK